MPSAQLAAVAISFRQRALAEAYVARFGRNMGMVALNQATGSPWGGSGQQGLSDWLMTHSPGAEPGSVIGRYSPEEMDFSNRLTQAVRPGEYQGAETALEPRTAQQSGCKNEKRSDGSAMADRPPDETREQWLARRSKELGVTIIPLVTAAGRKNG